jgi:hypothetical protein
MAFIDQRWFNFGIFFIILQFALMRLQSSSQKLFVFNLFLILVRAFWLEGIRNFLINSLKKLLKIGLLVDLKVLINRFRPRAWDQKCALYNCHSRHSCTTLTLFLSFALKSCVLGLPAPRGHDSWAVHSYMFRNCD